MVEIHLEKYSYTYEWGKDEVRVDFPIIFSNLFTKDKEYGFKDDFFFVNKVYKVIRCQLAVSEGTVHVTFAFVRSLNEPNNDIFERVNAYDLESFKELRKNKLGLCCYQFIEKSAKEIANHLDEHLLRKHNLPRKVFFNDKKKATTLLYGDEATVVKTCKGDKYDKEKGFLMAFFQKQSGFSKTQAKKYLKKITEEKE